MAGLDFLFNMHPEPFPGYKFNVFIQASVMSFSKISHLDDGVETDALVEGGMNHHVHSLQKPVSKERVVIFERGMAFRGVGTALLTSRFHVGQRLTTDIVVTICDRGGKLRNIFLLHGAVVKEWSCSDLDAMSSEILLERFTLAYQTFESFPQIAGIAGEAGAPGMIPLPNSREIAGVNQARGRQQQAAETRETRAAEQQNSADAANAQREKDVAERQSKEDAIRKRREAERLENEQKAKERETLRAQRRDKIRTQREKAAGDAF